MTVFFVAQHASLISYNKVLVVLTCTSKRSLKCSVDYVEQREALCRLVYAATRVRSTFSLGIHIPALSGSCVPFTRYSMPSLVTLMWSIWNNFGYSMTNHHHTFLTGFAWLLSRHTWFFAFRPFNSFAFILLCHRIQPLQQRSSFLIVQCHRGFWLSAVQRKRASPLLVALLFCWWCIVIGVKHPGVYFHIMAFMGSFHGFKFMKG